MCNQWESSSLHYSRLPSVLICDDKGPGKHLQSCGFLATKGQSLGLDVTTAAKLVGDRNVWCETEAESMAIRSNRSEQHKLETYKTLVMKEIQIHEHQYQQKEKLMHRKSAQLKLRINQIEDEYINDFKSGKPGIPEYANDVRSGKPGIPSSGKLLKRRRFSEANIDQVRNKANQRCNMCAQIERVISLYEKEKHPTGEHQDDVEHSTCLFSDVQMKAFLHLLETEHFQDVTNIASRLNYIRSASTFTTGSRNSSKLAKHHVGQNFGANAIEKRVKEFCLGLDTFNKATNCIPDSVKVTLEKTRHEDAVLLKALPLEPLSLREEVEMLFNIRKVPR